MTDHVWGRYLILRVINHDRPGECTNVGCALYGDDGVQLGYRVDPDGLARAVRRGDLGNWTPESLGPDYCANYLSNHSDVAQVEKSYQSMGHAMSCIQLGNLLPTMIEPDTIERIYQSYVLGKKTT